MTDLPTKPPKQTSQARRAFERGQRKAGARSRSPAAGLAPWTADQPEMVQRTDSTTETDRRWKLTLSSRPGSIVASCRPHASRSPESPKPIRFFYSCPWSPKTSPQLPTPRLLSTKPVGTSTHQNIKVLQEFVEPDILAHPRGDLV